MSDEQSGPEPVDVTDGVWDVVVVGAGPAGSSAAHAAAATGRRVLLLDKAAFPRYKTCGGGIIGPSRAAMPDGVKLPVLDEVRAITFTHGGRMRRTRRAKSTIFSLVSRVDLDAELVRVATEGGARFVPQVTVTRVEQEQGVVRLATSDGRSVRARAVVGADGSASRIGAHVGVSMEQVDLGLELEIPVPPSVADDWAHRVHIDWGPIPGSYGWVFPKGDTLTVGVIAARGNGEATRGYLADFVGRLGLAGFEPAVSSGQLTRCRAEDSPLARGRVLVAGDAAGLLEPWTREGISFALRSGRLAGEWAVQVAEQKGPVAVKREALNYEFAVKAGLGEEMRAGRRFLAAFARRPGAFHGAITTFRPAWSAFTEVVAGRSTFGLVLQRYAIARRALELVER